MIYLDFNATTRPDPAVLEVMHRVEADVWANPSSVHAPGRAARAVLDDSRYRLASRWKCKPSEVVFTSGGTEGNNTAILGTARLLCSKGRHLVTSTVEHPAVLEAFRYLERFEGFEVTWVPVDGTGRADPEHVAGSIRSDTTLVSIMAANNEVGTVQPVAEIGRKCRERGVLFHTDAVQTFGKLPFRDIHQFEADLVTVCAHKFHGPRGSGALFIRSPLLPHALMLGGAQENERRGGTENLPAIAGLTEAFDRFVDPPVFDAGILRTLSESLADGLMTIPNLERHGAVGERLPNTVAFTVEHADSISLLAGLDLEGIAASSGSACAAGSLEPSHVLKAMGVGPTRANGLIRFSLGRTTTATEVEAVVRIFPTVVARVLSRRSRSIRRPEST